MALTGRLRLSASQRLALTPGMRQSLAILRLPALDLSDEVARLAADNPFLIVRTALGRGTVLPEQADGPPSLYVALARQIAAQRLPDAVRDAARVLIAELREDGYLDATLAEIAAETDLPLPVLEAALTALQRCEPPGVGARDLPECLALQLVARGHPPDLARAICSRLDAFAEGRWPQLQRLLGLPQAELQRIAALLPGLKGRPAEPEPAPTVPRIPDLILSFAPDGSPRVLPNPDALPVVTLAPAMAGAGPDLTAARAEAGLIVAALRARVATLLRIGVWLVGEHRGHFTSALSEPLRPLTRGTAAAALAMHPSTLGRAIAGKAILAFGRPVPLDELFPRALQGPEGAVSAHAVQRRLRALIAAEPPGSPLADAALQAQLRKEGVDIARRTVAKYRKCMRIASSYERRRRTVPQDRPPSGSADGPAGY
ncbi:RNA polymerase factor sigma-54 [Frigidibacter oleivorans]|uniref:RNA polymerase factor sigma-54 n=1 Tax=Frigidibacter oleivorans TaxID=2487129 RepID=UPI000F8E9E02|nr:hypothetical protein [Frigidibacter oleivorans]